MHCFKHLGMSVAVLFTLSAFAKPPEAPRPADLVAGVDAGTMARSDTGDEGPLGPAEKHLMLRTGQKQPQAVPATLTRLAVGDPDVCDITLLGESKLMLKGGKAGTTTILIWLKDGTRHVWDVTVTK